MAQQLSPELLALLMRASHGGAQRQVLSDGRAYMPDYQRFNYSGADSVGSDTGDGGVGLMGFSGVDPNEAKSSRMIDEFGMGGDFTGQRKDSYTNPMQDLATWAALATGANGIGSMLTGGAAAGAGAAGMAADPFAGLAAEMAAPVSMAGSIAPTALPGVGAGLGAGLGAGTFAGLGAEMAAPVSMGGSIAPAASFSIAPGATAGAGGGLLSSGGASPMSSAQKLATYGSEGYGPGMSGTQTSAFDTVLDATGSTAAAKAASDAAGLFGGLGMKDLGQLGLAAYGASQSKSGETTNKVQPWEPAQDFLKYQIGQGQQLSKQMQQQPFSQAQQTAYGNVGGLLDIINQQAPGLLSGIGSYAGAPYQRGMQAQRPAFKPLDLSGFGPGLLGNFGTGGR